MIFKMYLMLWLTNVAKLFFDNLIWIKNKFICRSSNNHTSNDIDFFQVARHMILIIFQNSAAHKTCLKWSCSQCIVYLFWRHCWCETCNINHFLWPTFTPLSLSALLISTHADSNDWYLLKSLSHLANSGCRTWCLTHFQATILDMYPILKRFLNGKTSVMPHPFIILLSHLMQMFHYASGHPFICNQNIWLH